MPTFVQIDNGYDEAAGPGKVSQPPQLFAPLITFRATRESREAGAKQAAQLAFDRPFEIGDVAIRTAAGDELETRYAHFTTLAHPGERAPLGWTLSRDSFDDLLEEFERSQEPRLDAAGNLVARSDSALDRVATWFSGLTCTVPG